LKSHLVIRNNVVQSSGVLGAIQIGDKMIVLTNPSEVLANNDELTFDINVRGKILTDQAYTKVLSSSNVKISVNMEMEDSSYFPHPVLFYNNANFEMVTEIRSKGKNSVVEAFILGRRGSGEKFVKGKINAITKIYSEHGLIAYDVFRVNDEDYLDLIGNDALLTVYYIEDGELASFTREILSYKDVFKEWSKITGIWF